MVFHDTIQSRAEDFTGSTPENSHIFTFEINVDRTEDDHKTDHVAWKSIRTGSSFLVTFSVKSSGS